MGAICSSPKTDVASENRHRSQNQQQQQSSHRATTKQNSVSSSSSSRTAANYAQSPFRLPSSSSADGVYTPIVSGQSTTSYASTASSSRQRTSSSDDFARAPQLNTPNNNNNNSNSSSNNNKNASPSNGSTTNDETSTKHHQPQPQQQQQQQRQHEFVNVQTNRVDHGSGRTHPSSQLVLGAKFTSLSKKNFSGLAVINDNDESASSFTSSEFLKANINTSTISSLQLPSTKTQLLNSASFNSQPHSQAARLLHQQQQEKHHHQQFIKDENLPGQADGDDEDEDDDEQEDIDNVSTTTSITNSKTQPHTSRTAMKSNVADAPSNLQHHTNNNNNNTNDRTSASFSNPFVINTKSVPSGVAKEQTELPSWQKFIVPITRVSREPSRAASPSTTTTTTSTLNATTTDGNEMICVNGVCSLASVRRKRLNNNESGM